MCGNAVEGRVVQSSEVLDLAERLDRRDDRNLVHAPMFGAVRGQVENAIRQSRTVVPGAVPAAGSSAASSADLRVGTASAQPRVAPEPCSERLMKNP